MIKGKVIDKGTGMGIPGVSIFVTDEKGEYVENAEGYLGTETSSKGSWSYELLPGQYLSFEKTAYPRIIKPYETLVRSGRITMDDASGTALNKSEINAYLKDMRKLTSGQWMMAIGFALLAVLLVVIIAKKIG